MLSTPPPSESNSLLYAAAVAIGGAVAHVFYRVITPMYVRRMEKTAKKIEAADKDTRRRLAVNETTVAKQTKQITELLVTVAEVRKDFAHCEEERIELRRLVEGKE